MTPTEISAVAVDGTISQTRCNDWTITFTGLETTPIEYKYALGSWDYVEKDGTCSEIGNRQLTLAYGTTGTQNVNDTVLNWRGTGTCPQ